MSYEEIVCDANNLYKAYLATVKGTKWKETSQRFSLNFLRNIFQIIDELSTRTLQNGKVTEFELHERGRIRPISSLPVKDRVVRHVLCDEVLLPAVRKKIIYDNGASIKGRGISFARKRFKVHLHNYYREHGNTGYALFGDFTKFYDNIIHEQAKSGLLKLFDNDEFVEWLLDLIFDSFKVDVSYMSDKEYADCMSDTFNKLEYRKIPKSKLTGEKFMMKSVNIGDQLAQILGVYYPYRMDTYVKYVRGKKYYGRYMDDWYIFSPSKKELLDILENIREIVGELGIHLNDKKTKIVRMDRPMTYLQVKYTLTDSGKVTEQINPKRVTGMRRKLKKLAVKVENGTIPYLNVENMFKGWMGSHYKLLTRSQRAEMVTLFENLFGKSIKIVKKKMIIADKTDLEEMTL